MRLAALVLMLTALVASATGGPNTIRCPNFRA
jgi:hypothetical protein